MKSRLLFGSLLWLVSSLAGAEETILSFHSDIEVRRNGDLYVTETINVKAEGKEIRRGIYRDFPTHYKTPQGRSMTVGFEFQTVSRDGKPEPFHLENRSNGKRVYIGDRNVYLSPGLYEYRLSYLTTRQLGFFEDFDELYWNVTGTGWIFPIERASAMVSLPDTVSDFRLTGYTGPQGSTAQNLLYRRDGNNRVYFETTRPLARKQGLTIVAGWPKGIVETPSAAQQRSWFLQDNKALIIVTAGLVALFVYYLLIWRWYGRDPEAGVVVPHYRPPEGYSPASMRFVENMGYDKKCFTSAIVNLAAKGVVSIRNDDDEFRIIRKENPPIQNLAAGEREILIYLFDKGASFSVEQRYHATLSKAIDKHESSLKRDYEKKYFNTNRWLLIPGSGLTILLIALAIASLPSEEVIMKTIFFGIFTLMPPFVAYTAIRQVLRHGKKGIVRWGIFLVPLFGILAFFYSLFPYAEFLGSISVPLVLVMTSMVVINILFYQLLKSPTLVGRRLLDQIEGFRHYLEVAEEDEIALADAPEFTTDIYEAYLPYAIALDLENEWTARLDRAIRQGLIEPGYRYPGWYHSRGHQRMHFSSALSRSMNSAIASSSIAPGSSSGSSGGFSGGGGGGGGGGGW